MGMSKRRRARRSWRRVEDRIHYKTPKEIRLMKDAGMLVYEAFQMLEQHVAPASALKNWTI